MNKRKVHKGRSKLTVGVVVFAVGIASGVGYIVAGVNVCDLECEYVGTKMVCKPVNCRHEDPNCETAGIGLHPCD